MAMTEVSAAYRAGADPAWCRRGQPPRHTGAAPEPRGSIGWLPGNTGKEHPDLTQADVTLALTLALTPEAARAIAVRMPLASGWPRCCEQICPQQRTGVSPAAVPHAGGMAHEDKNPLFSERVREQLLLQRILVLDGPLDDDNGTLLATQLLTLAADDPVSDIALWINSPGGSVPSMLAIRDVMRLVPCDVSTLALGLACSAGQFLLSAGTRGKRFALPHARILMHRGSAGIGGSAVDIEVQADDLRHTVDTVLGLIAEDTGQPVERIFDDSLHDHWYTAAEAREFGFIDEIVDSFGQVMPARKHRIGLKGALS